MRQTLSIFLLFLIWNTAFSNDGIYLTSGSNIYPISETRISLDKEVLSYSISNGIATVNINFEFNNPENISRKLKVGFQAPSSVGDVTDRYSNSPQIRDFKIQSIDGLLPFEIKAAECEDCPLKDTSEIDFSQFESGVFVYLFEIEFKPGVNTIQHSYSYPASNNVSVDEMYDYILTTGAKWAGQTIKDFRLDIDFGTNSYFYVKDMFGPTAKWTINGTGKVTDTGFSFEEFNRMVRIISGNLSIEVKNFRPESNLEIGVICNSSFISYLLDNKNVSSRIYNSLQYRTTDLKSLTTDDALNKEELRICRNYLFAKYGYDFNSPDLKVYFSQFGWYIPDPNLKMTEIILTEREKKYLDEIIEKEKNN